MNYQRKLFLLQILLVALPSLLLSIFAIYSLWIQKDIFEKQVIDTYSRFAENVRLSISEKLNQNQQDIDLRMQQLRFNEGQISVPQLSNLLFPHVFIIDKDNTILYPKARPKYETNNVKEKSFDHLHLFQQGYIYEFHKSDYHLAIKEYEKIVDEKNSVAKTNFARIGDALIAIARCYRKVHNYGLALARYRNINTVFGGRTNPWELKLNIYAKMQIANIQKRQGDLHECYQTLLSLLEYVIYNEYRLEKPKYEFFYENITTLLKHLDSESQIKLSKREQLLTYYSGIKKSHRETIANEQAIDILTKYIMPELKFIRKNDSGYFLYKMNDRKHPAYFTTFPNFESNSKWMVIYKIDFKYYLQKIIIPALKKQENDNIFITVVNEEGRPLVGEVKKFYHRIDSQPIPSFPFWQVDVYIKDIQFLENLTQRRSQLYFGGIVMAIMVLFFGLYAFISTFIQGVKSTRLKSDFVSNVTHELKTPLTAIKMFVETLLMGRTKDEEDERECLQVIAVESDRLSHLIDRILDFAKMEKNKRSFYFAQEDIGDVVEATVRNFQKQLAGDDCQINVEINQDLPTITIDKEAIGEALLNLLSNAYKYIANEEKKIFIHCWQQNKNKVAILVKDNGIGIAKHELERIFQKFYRIEDPRSRRIEGTGLGLALVAAIMKAHGGEIKVHSKVAIGSEFTLIFPINRS